MAHETAQAIPIKGVPLSLSWRIRLYTTANPLTGSSLSNLRATISKDGSAFAATTNAPVQIGTTGIGTLALTATEMNANKVIVQVLCDDSGAVYDYIELEPLRMDEIAVPAPEQTYPRFEQWLGQVWSRWHNTNIDNGDRAYVLKRGETSETDVADRLLQNEITQTSTRVVMGQYRTPSS